MIETGEHFYHDDPKAGHPDVRTELPGVNYFFLGNGLIQAAVQSAPAAVGATRLGLLVMNPDRLRKKRDALTLDARDGLGATKLRLVTTDGSTHTAIAGRSSVRWLAGAGIPTVQARWRAPGLAVEEHFFCPEWNAPRLWRRVVIRNLRRTPVRLELVTGVKQQTCRKPVVIPGGGRRSGTLTYTLNAAADAVRCAWTARVPRQRAARQFWRGLAGVSFGHPWLDHCFRASRAQLPAAVSRLGCMDGSIWQYNLEWLRDQSMVALALTYLGATGPAATIFARLLDKFVTPDGDTLDSSVQRDPADVELDQNGCLLTALRDYVLWTGDLGLVRRQWAKVAAVAEFPLRGVFRHPESGLLVNRREFWERHKAYGIQPGMELIYQVYVALGLEAAATLARLTRHAAEAERWAAEAGRLRRALLEHPRFRMHDARGFIKRRAPDGAVQETIVAQPEAQLPREVPMGGPGPHRLNPDTSAALPIALGMIPADSPLARRTLRSLEQLWNQAWRGGGYGRYDVSSEPDSPGGWPFASLFVARAAAEAGDWDKVWRVLHWLENVAGAEAGTWFEFYGRRLAPPFPQVGIVVWNWAEVVILLVRHLLGAEAREEGLRIRPRLPAGVNRADATLMLRGKPLALRIRRRGKGKAEGAVTVGYADGCRRVTFAV